MTLVVSFIVIVQLTSTVLVLKSIPYLQEEGTNIRIYGRDAGDGTNCCKMMKEVLLGNGFCDKENNVDGWLLVWNALLVQ